ncbi:hypothetical protein FKP32DRAFT_1599869 [Trametes sanguinea]|nr:hypothetical protein FKP32DRAFT_1599869 [Trametes sanguinea]
MSHDGARHIAPLSPPPTLLVEAKELPADEWSKAADHSVESWRYGDNQEDGGGSPSPFPPVRDDSGFEETAPEGGCEDGRQRDGSHGDRALIEPTSVWIPHSPLSISDGLPLADLPPLHGSGSSSGPHDSLFLSPASNLSSWTFGSDMGWGDSPSSTLVGGLSAPASPKPASLSVDPPDFGYTLGLSPHQFLQQQQQQPSLISPLDIPFQQGDRPWFVVGFGASGL